MSKNFTIELLGANEVGQIFGDLPKQFTDQVLGDIAQRGASVIRSEARRSMPVDGVLGQVGKKAVIIAKNRSNKTERIVTIGGKTVDYKGNQVSVGKIIRHMTAGNQSFRKTKAGYKRGKVAFRLGDFIQRAFDRKRDQAIEVMTAKSKEIIERRASKLK